MWPQVELGEPALEVLGFGKAVALAVELRLDRDRRESV